MFNGSTTDDAGKSKPALVAVVMLGILGGSVALAWWISSSREQYVQQGNRLVEKIHRLGLRAFWKGPSENYYLIRENDATVGWRADLRIPTKGGGFEGLSIRFFPKETKNCIYERWKLNPDATRGDYSAGGLDANGNVTVIDTAITLEKGRVNVVQLLSNGRQVPSSVLAPDNYLPEGTLPLAEQLVAQEKSQAFFKLVYNSKLPNAGGKGQTAETSLGLANLKPAGQHTLQGGKWPIQTNIVEIRRAALGREEAQTDYLRPDGTRQCIEAGDSSETFAGGSEVVEVDPNAQVIINRVARQLRFNLDAVHATTKSGVADSAPAPETMPDDDLPPDDETLSND